MLTRATITGADEGVDHTALADLSDEFPFVEWGILISEKAGRPRYPTARWVIDIARHSADGVGLIAAGRTQAISTPRWPSGRKE